MTGAMASFGCSFGALRGAFFYDVRRLSNAARSAQ